MMTGRYSLWLCLTAVTGACLGISVALRHWLAILAFAVAFVLVIRAAGRAL